MNQPGDNTMKLRSVALAAAALGLLSAPVAASVVRDAAPVEMANQVEGNSEVFYVLGVAAVIAAIVLLASDDNDPISG
jgi:hypothetical protein